MDLLTEATAGRYYYAHNRIMLNLTSRRSGAKYVLAANDKLYGFMELKTNKQIHVSTVMLASQEFPDPIKAFESLAARAKSYDLIKKLNISDVTTFIKTVLTLGINTAQLFETFPELRNSLDDHCEYIVKFCLVIGEAPQKQVDIAKELIKQAGDILQKHGYSGLAYGKMILTKQIKSKQLASYNPAEDTINLWSGHLKAGKEAVRTILHELGHRLWYKGAVDKQPVFQIYSEVTSSGESFKIGDEIQSKSTPEKIFKIVEIKYGRTLQYVVVKPGQEDPRYIIKGASRAGWIKLNSQQKRSVFDVSGYAHTSVEEFFAEIFGFGLIDSIPEITDFLKKHCKTK